MVGFAEEDFDLLIVDEAHRLNQRTNQPSGVQNRNFRLITEKLFGSDDKTKTQLDWIRTKSRHQILLVDAEQSIRPADISREDLSALVTQAKGEGRHYSLTTQMRVSAGSHYVRYIRLILGSVVGEVLPNSFEGYDLRFFDSVVEMRDAIHRRDAEVGLSRLLAGYAWRWKSKNDKSAFDIEEQGHTFRWNSVQTGWVASPNSLSEVGSIHTVQGYDLNYAGVIIGPDLRYDPVRDKLFIDRASYFDTKGKENNPTLGKIYTDDDLLRYISNIYAVLLTRGMLGTYVYVSDPELREHLRPFFGGARLRWQGGPQPDPRVSRYVSGHRYQFCLNNRCHFGRSWVVTFLPNVWGLSSIEPDSRLRLAITVVRRRHPRSGRGCVADRPSGPVSVAKIGGDIGRWINSVERGSTDGVILMLSHLSDAAWKRLRPLEEQILVIDPIGSRRRVSSRSAH